MTRIELDGLTRRRPDGTAILDGIDLDVADGELVALLGPSGAGKSALLATVMGLAEVTAGELRLGGEPATDWAPAERDLGMVFQDHAPYPHLRVRDNIGFPLRLAGVPAAEIRRRVAEVAQDLEVTVHLDRWPSQLSGGQRQRVAIGRVIVRRPGGFLLDDPLSDADPALRSRLRALLTRLQRDTGTTTLWVSTDPTEAAAIGDRVAVLRGGRLEQVDTPRGLSERPATLFVAALTGRLNVLAGEVADGVLRLPVGAVPLDPAALAALAGRDRVVAAIRPEDLLDAADRPADGVRIPLLVGEQAGAEPYARLRHPALARAAATAAAAGDAPRDAPLSEDLLARLDPAGRRSVTGWLDPRRLLLFDAGTGAALRPR